MSYPERMIFFEVVIPTKRRTPQMRPSPQGCNGRPVDHLTFASPRVAVLLEGNLLPRKPNFLRGTPQADVSGCFK